MIVFDLEQGTRLVEAKLHPLFNTRDLKDSVGRLNPSLTLLETGAPCVHLNDEHVYKYHLGFQVRYEATLLSL